MASGASKKPQRRCIACGKQTDKASLYRIVRSPQSEIFYDAQGRAAGRGAYVCCPQCLEKAVKTQILSRSLKCSITSNDYDRISDQARAWRPVGD